jgi:hypothetical protein
MLPNPDFGAREPDLSVNQDYSVYGELFARRLRAMAEWPTERLIGSIRRESLDHVVVFGERHLRHALLSYKLNYKRQDPSLSKQG